MILNVCGLCVSHSLRKVIHVGELFGDSVCMTPHQAPWGRTTSRECQEELAANFHCILKVRSVETPNPRDFSIVIGNYKLTGATKAHVSPLHTLFFAFLVILLRGRKKKLTRILPTESNDVGRKIMLVFRSSQWEVLM